MVGCDGDNEYEPDVFEYSVEVGENDCESNNVEFDVLCAEYDVSCVVYEVLSCVLSLRDLVCCVKAHKSKTFLPDHRFSGLGAPRGQIFH